MIAYEDFNSEIKRLLIGHAKDISAKFLSDLVSTWYEMISKSFPDMSILILKGMVDKSIETGDRFPSYSQFRAFKQQVQLPRAFKSQGPCNFSCCDKGFVLAWREEEGFGNRQTTFRCAFCDEWKAPSVPFWGDEAIEAGYKLGRMPRGAVAFATDYAPKTLPGYDERSEKEAARQQSLRMDDIREQGIQRESLREDWY